MTTGPPFTITTDGDEFERGWWPQWTRAHFPSYEVFWREHVVPLTNRDVNRHHVDLKTPDELAELGFDEEDVFVSQLHYMLLTHLGRVFELVNEANAFAIRTPLANRQFGRSQFLETFVRLGAATDIADELLARRAKPGKYKPWKESHGKRARRDWRKRHDDPLKTVRSYRNRLLRGRVVPGVHAYADDTQNGRTGQLLLYPRLDEVEKYLDWRKADAAAKSGSSSDFAEAAVIAGDAWERVVGHVETMWQEELVGRR